MEEGLVVYLHFDEFELETGSSCQFDYLRIMDSDGTTLMEKNCGENGNLPPDVLSTSNIVNLVFITDGSVTRTGWSVSWTAVEPGECPQ